MNLVYQSKKKASKLEVAWTWLPAFISMDSEFVKHVASTLTHEFKGRDITERSLAQMHDRVLACIADRFGGIPGLFEYVRGVEGVEP